jgi:hypothetical protein
LRTPCTGQAITHYPLQSLRTTHLHQMQNLLLHLSGMYERYAQSFYSCHSAVDLAGLFLNHY